MNAKELQYIHYVYKHPDQLSKAKLLRGSGSFYHKIAEEVGVSTMTVYRALNGKTKNIGDSYDSH